MHGSKYEARIRAKHTLDGGYEIRSAPWSQRRDDAGSRLTLWVLTEAATMGGVLWGAHRQRRRHHRTFWLPYPLWLNLDLSPSCSA